jgi:hypothetical protein
MIVALIFLQSALSVRTSSTQELTNGSQYAVEALNVLLTSTAPSAKASVGHPGVNQTLTDWSIRDLMLWDIYLTSCNSTNQSVLNQPGWVGWVINSSASTVAKGAPAGGNPVLFSNYYLEFNGTARGASSCNGTPVPIHIVMGQKPPVNLTSAFTSDNVLIPPSLPGEGGIEVVMGLWGEQ